MVMDFTAHFDGEIRLTERIEGEWVLQEDVFTATFLPKMRWCLPLFKINQHPQSSPFV